MPLDGLRDWPEHKCPVSGQNPPRKIHSVNQSREFERRQRPILLPTFSDGYNSRRTTSAT